MNAFRGAVSEEHAAPRALLVQPPVYDFALYDLFHQPFGLLRIGAWLRDAGYDVELLDSLDTGALRTRAGSPGRRREGRGRIHRRVVATPEPLRALGRRFARYGAEEAALAEGIRSANPDVILVSTGMTYWYPGVAEISRVVREVRPDIPLIGGGVYASLLRDHCSEQMETDLVFGGRADRRFAAALGRLGLPEPNGAPPYLPGSDLLQHSARLRDAAVVRLNDGCPLDCAYCAARVLVPQFRSGDPEALHAHVADLHLRCGISTFAFYDDALLVRPEAGLVPFLNGILERFGRRRLRFYVPNAVHAEAITDDLARLMYEAGFREVRFGLESTNPAFHDAMDGKLDPDRVAAAVEHLFRAGFTGREITAYVLLGVPGQEFGDTRRTLHDAAGLGINVSLAEYSPVPGTRLFHEAQERSGLDLAGEPLFHNNSAYWFLSGAVTEAEMDEARSIVLSVRERLRRGMIGQAG